MGEFTDVEPVASDSPIRQGDILRSEESEHDGHPRLTIVATADCDIVHSKNNDILSVVPLMPIVGYFHEVYLPRKRERELRPAFEQLSSIIHDLQRKYRPEFPSPISDDRAKAWILEEEPEQILKTLGVPEGIASREFIALCVAVTFLSAAGEAALGDQIRYFAAVTHAMGRSKTTGKAEESIRKELAASLRQLPGDSMYVHGSGDVLPFSPGIAYLRILREVNAKEVSIRAWRAPASCQYTRIARLQERYIHHLTQRLGAVFSSIGLPRQYEDARNLFVDNLPAFREE